jgi:hypothetical protein
VFLSGAANLPYYPYRNLVKQKILTGDERFVMQTHPGYGLPLHNISAAVGCAYADRVNDHLAAITDGSTLNYAIAKVSWVRSHHVESAFSSVGGFIPGVGTRSFYVQVFEIPATGALLLLNQEMVPIVHEFGFQPYVHFVPYTAETLDAVVDSILDASNRARVDSIRQQGQQLVWSRHLSLHRAAAIDALAAPEHAA